MPRFAGKVAIITGSSSGIGSATAVLFAREGAQVTITGRNQTLLEETTKEILKVSTKENIHVVVGDITKEDVQKNLVQSTVDKFGKLDILINNAGASMLDSNGKFGLDANPEVLTKNLDLNLISVLKLVNIARPHLIASKGEIVNISSIAGLPFSFESAPFYAISKAGLDQLTRALSTDLIQHGVRVNSVNPGAVRTRFCENMGMSKDVAEKIYEKFDENSLYNRVPSAEHIAPVIAFLADRSQSEYILGQTIVVDGGSTNRLQSSSLSKLAQKK